MSLESLIMDSGQRADISVEAPDGQVPLQDVLGGAIRTDPWPSVVQGVPCLVSPRASTLQAFPPRNDARANVSDTRIYFLADPVPSGLSTRHRITVVVDGVGGPSVLGVYAVQNPNDPNSMGRILQVDCEKVRNP
jgi:hypothetical protein